MQMPGVPLLRLLCRLEGALGLEFLDEVVVRAHFVFRGPGKADGARDAPVLLLVFGRHGRGWGAGTGCCRWRAFSLARRYWR